MPNYGKQFENKFRQDWNNSFPGTFLLRLNDQVSGYKYTSANLCDFIAYVDGKLFLLECKSHAGASLPFSSVSQYDRLKQFVGIPGIRVGIILWLYEKDKCLYVPIKTVTKLLSNNEQSVGIRHLGTEELIDIPSKKKRVFLDSDYKQLLDLEETW